MSNPIKATDEENSALAELGARLGMKPSAAATDLIELFELQAFPSVEAAEAYIVERKESKAHWFKDAPTIDPEREALCFGKGHVSARGALVNSIGEPAATARAQAWGLKDIHDYKTQGVAPADAKPDPNAKPKKPAATNPWSREAWSVTEQGRIARVMGFDKASNLAKAAGVVIGATRPV